MKIDDLRVGDLVYFAFCGKEGVHKVARILDPHWTTCNEYRIILENEDLYATLHTVRPATPEEILLWKLENA